MVASGKKRVRVIRTSVFRGPRDIGGLFGGGKAGGILWKQKVLWGASSTTEVSG